MKNVLEFVKKIYRDYLMIFFFNKTVLNFSKKMFLNKF